MTLSRIAPAAGIALALSVAAGPASAGTTTYKGTGYATSTYVLLPLASGGAAVHLTNSNVITIEPSDGAGFMFGECAGLGHLNEAADKMSGLLYCTFEEDPKNGFDLKADMTRGEGGTVEIVGGSGKWKGATGKGTVKSKFTEGNRSSFEYEFQITTP